jgi:hypothetical protein
VRYLGLVKILKALMVDPAHALSAAVYTELADVEAEINGLITYDRKAHLSPCFVHPLACKRVMTGVCRREMHAGGCWQCFCTHADLGFLHRVLSYQES